MFLLALSLFFNYPSALDMPRAEAYRLKYTDGTIAVEDRYNENDLWTSRAVLGRWEDDEGRIFTVSRLDIVPPLYTEVTTTRSKYVANEVKIDPKKDLEIRDQAIRRLSPVTPTDDPARPRQTIRGFKEVLYFEGTNTSAIVCAFLKEGAPFWYLATWELAEGDEQDYSREIFEEEFLEKFDEHLEKNLRSEIDLVNEKPRYSSILGAAIKRKLKGEQKSERELMRLDARHSVTNYTSWHVTEAEEFTILDALPESVRFINILTNDLTIMRSRYAAALPSPVVVTNTLCVARIFADRGEYLAAVGEDMKWSAAYWDPTRRELVAYLPESGVEELKTAIRHEAFHQYLSYACSMITASPWLNEGYAQYFEDEESLDWKLGEVGPEKLEALAEYIPTLLGLDYSQFYSEDASLRQHNYRLAWSIAVFLEKGAPKIRFQPFENLKRDYIAALLRSADMREATLEAFKNRDRLKLFVSEWLKFWKNM